MMNEYIDRNALKEGIKYHYQSTDQEYETERQWAVGYNAGLNRALYSIAYARAADVAPVRHGHWIFEEFDGIGCAVKCSLCGYGNDCCDRNVWLRFPGHHYCGSCGAKMNEES